MIILQTTLDEFLHDFVSKLETKKEKHPVIMLDMYGKRMPMSTNKRCWWDRNTFKNPPLGCPMKYVSAGHLTIDQKAVLQDNLGFVDDYFETEGIFCSLSCIQEYLYDQTTFQYRDSFSLLGLMTAKLGLPLEIPRTNSWKALQEYGGTLNINEFRSKNVYVETGNFKRLVLFPMAFELEQLGAHGRFNK